MEESYHFDGVTAATSSEDGEHVLIETTGSAGACNLRLPTADVPRAVTMLMAAAANAMQTSGSKVMRTMDVRSIKVEDIPGSEEVLLQIGVHTGAPPIALKLTRQQLAGFALSTLQTMGIAPTEIPGSIQ